MSDKLITLSEDQVMRYLELVDRRMFIVMHSGVDWKPEYAQELEAIDSEIAVLRTAIDAAHAARHLAQGQEPETVSENVATDCMDSGESVSGQEAETVSRNITTPCKDSVDSCKEQELVNLYRRCDDRGKSSVLHVAKAQVKELDIIDFPKKGNLAPSFSRPGRKPPLSNT